MSLVTVGQIVNIFGVQGELKIVSFSHFSNKRYLVGTKLLVKDETKGLEQWVTVKSYRSHRGLDLVSFEEIDTNNAAKYFSWYVLAEKNDLKLPKGSFFYDDLYGCEVVDEDGAHIGKVTTITDYGAHATLIIDVQKDKPMQVPFVPFFIKKVDLKTKTITIHVIEGL